MATTMAEPLAPWLRELGAAIRDQSTGGAFVPPADLLIDEDGVTVYMDVPGLHVQDLEIELENDVLTVRGERTFPYAREDGKGPVRRIERAFGRFERSIRVPRGLEPDSVQAALSDGVLKLWIPKPETLKPHRIPVHTESNGQHEDSRGS